MVVCVAYSHSRDRCGHQPVLAVIGEGIRPLLRQVAIGVIASGGLPGLHQPVVHVVDGVALAQAIGRDRGPVAGGVIAIAQNAIDPLSRGDAANRVITE